MLIRELKTISSIHNSIYPEGCCVNSEYHTQLSGVELLQKL